MLDLIAFVYRHWQVRTKQTVRQNYENELNRNIMGHLPTMVLGASIFLCLKNYSNVNKEMSALSVTDQNLEAFSQRQ